MNSAWGWYNEEHSIVLVQVGDKWSINDARAYTREYWPLIQQQPHPVDVIFDLRASASPPLGSIGDLMWIATGRPANAGALIFIVKREVGLAIVWALRQALTRSFPNFPLYGARTMEQALAIINALRAPETPQPGQDNAL